MEQKNSIRITFISSMGIGNFFSGRFEINRTFFSVILNIPLFEFRILHIFHLVFQLLVLKRPQTKFKIHHVQAIYPLVSSINESKELF